jgi:hypothetical protein
VATRSGAQRPEQNCLTEPPCAFRVSGGRSLGRDLCAELPVAAVEAMAATLRGLRVSRVASRGGAGWSEFLRPWGREGSGEIGA